MEERTLGGSTWLAFGVLGVFVRGVPGWEELLAGAPTSEWLAPVTLAFLWGAFTLFGFLGAFLEEKHTDSDGINVIGAPGVLALWY
jgi:hypothetical protein